MNLENRIKLWCVGLGLTLALVGVSGEEKNRADYLNLKAIQNVQTTEGRHIARNALGYTFLAIFGMSMSGGILLNYLEDNKRRY